MNSELKSLLNLALSDLEKLRYNGLVYAGLPHFFCLFGRDAIITSLELLDYDPEVARNTLIELAKLQGKEFNAIREEEPGKIIHEFRMGEEVARFHWEFPYYGATDSTPLFLVLLFRYYEATGDLKLVKKLWKNALLALKWIFCYGDLDNDLFIEYERRNGHGLKNQGWKDSHDSIHHPNGNLATPPIALVEVQGYTYQALLGMYYIASKLNKSWASLLREHAYMLQDKFNKVFWMEKEQYFALGIDGEKQQIKTITSNPGHLLCSGIVDKERAVKIAKRLMEKDMFSGWGVRTLSSESKLYDPDSYHNGAVWFHDNWIILEGLKRYGLVDEANKIKEGLIAAAHRLASIPELFGGHSREEFDKPFIYKNACHAQAWAAGALINLLHS